MLNRIINHIKWRLEPKKPSQGFHHDAGYPKANGRRYEAVFADYHRSLDIDWYLEVGTETGKGLRPVRCNIVSVDPEFRLIPGVIGNKPQAHFFQMTSAAFFKTNFLSRNNIRCDVAFLDGLHHFEALLDDFIGTEKAMRPHGAILIHDCVPYNKVMAAREWDKSVTHNWTGDVWKLLPILKKIRPDLTITVYDAAPTGLVCITNLNPDDTTLTQARDSEVDTMQNTTIEDYRIDRFRTLLNMTDCEHLIRDLPGSKKASQT